MIDRPSNIPRMCPVNFGYLRKYSEVFGKCSLYLRAAMSYPLHDCHYILRPSIIDDNVKLTRSRWPSLFLSCWLKNISAAFSFSFFPLNIFAELKKHNIRSICKHLSSISKLRFLSWFFLGVKPAALISGVKQRKQRRQNNRPYP